MKTIQFFWLSLCLFLSIESLALERLEWSQFKQSDQYNGFVSAIQKMRSNNDPNDSNSWLYWANIHEEHCPHGVSYFLAWHRGYLYLFEKKLQEQEAREQERQAKIEIKKALDAQEAEAWRKETAKRLEAN